MKVCGRVGGVPCDWMACVPSLTAPARSAFLFLSLVTTTLKASCASLESQPACHRLSYFNGIRPSVRVFCCSNRSKQAATVSPLLVRVLGDSEGV